MLGMCVRRDSARSFIQERASWLASFSSHIHFGWRLFRHQALFTAAGDFSGRSLHVLLFVDRSQLLFHALDRLVQHELGGDLQSRIQQLGYQLTVSQRKYYYHCVICCVFESWFGNILTDYLANDLFLQLSDGIIVHQRSPLHVPIGMIQQLGPLLIDQGLSIVSIEWLHVILSQNIQHV